MALTAANFTAIDFGVIGDMRYWIGNMVGDSSYSTGGSSITPAMVGMTTGLLFLTAEVPTAGNKQTVPLKQADGSFKLKLFTGAAGLATEFTNAASDATSTYLIFVVGR